MNELISRFIELTSKKEAKEDELDAVKKELEQVKILLALHMAADNMHRVSGVGYTVYLNSRVFASLSDQERFKKFCKGESVKGEALKTLYDVLFRETVSANTLSAFVRNRLTEGKEVPDSVNVFYDIDVRKRSK